MSTIPVPVFSDYEFDTFNDIREARDSLRQAKSNLRSAEDKFEKANAAQAVAQRELTEYQETVVRYEKKMVDLRKTVLMLFGGKEEPVSAPPAPIVDHEDIGSRER